MVKNKFSMSKGCIKIEPSDDYQKFGIEYDEAVKLISHVRENAVRAAGEDSDVVAYIDSAKDSGDLATICRVLEEHM